jgi:hypothetical protein
MAHKALILAYVGRHQEARALRDVFGDIGAEEDETNKSMLGLLFEAAILGEDRETVAVLAPRLAAISGNIRAGIAGGFETSLARLLGLGAVLLGKPDEARAYYAQAMEVAGRMRFRPELALVHLDLAELLLAHYPERHEEASKHLDFAIEELRAMKMQPFLERALRHKGLLHA